MIPFIIGGFLLLKAGEAITDWMVEQKNIKETNEWVKDHPRFVLTQQMLYPSPLQKRIAEKDFPASDEDRWNALCEAEKLAEKHGPMLRQIQQRLGA